VKAVQSDPTEHSGVSLSVTLMDKAIISVDERFAQYWNIFVKIWLGFLFNVRRNMAEACGDEHELRALFVWTVVILIHDMQWPHWWLTCWLQSYWWC